MSSPFLSKSSQLIMISIYTYNDIKYNDEQLNGILLIPEELFKGGMFGADNRQITVEHFW